MPVYDNAVASQLYTNISLATQNTPPNTISTISGDVKSSAKSLNVEKEIAPSVASTHVESTSGVTISGGRSRRTLYVVLVAILVAVIVIGLAIGIGLWLGWRGKSV